MRKYLRSLFLVLLIVLAAGGGWAFMFYFEGEKPEIRLNRDIEIIGQETTFDITCIDEKRGIRSVSVTISQDAKKCILASLKVPGKGVNTTFVPVSISPEKLKLHDGTATIDISVTDYSLRKNKQIMIFEVVIDTIPPTIFPVSPHHYITPGGSCVVGYRLSEDATRSGVGVDSDYFPSYPRVTKDGTLHIAYFAVPTTGTSRNMKIRILAEDSAGNTTSTPVSFHLRNKRFRSDRMNISQRFLEMKVPEFQRRYKDLRGLTLLEAFSRINNQMRMDNTKTIEAICEDTHPEQLWKGSFLRMRNAATMATFGDRRTYYHSNKQISTSIHLGIDLASTRSAPVMASNSGIVVFTGPIGIYGNTVIIDHGMGVFSLYGHLSSICTQKGQPVKRGEGIGRTGLTGMAGGDHLHFSMIVGGKFVNPVEWWDSHWIEDNVTRKLVSW